jgi:alpha-galactosidase
MGRVHPVVVALPIFAAACGFTPSGGPPLPDTSESNIDGSAPQSMSSSGGVVDASIGSDASNDGTAGGQAMDSASANASPKDSASADASPKDSAPTESSSTQQSSLASPAPIFTATPPMGWNDWNAFHSSINEDIVKMTADAMVSSGMQAAGYQFVNLDDTWMSTRDSSGQIVANASKFPDGIAAVAQYVHSKGLKMGIYTCAGTSTCAGLPGSYGHEVEDAQTYASWGIDYVKEDFCYTPSAADPKTLYTTMHDAIVATGRPMVFSLCDWGVDSPWDFGPGIANLWRTTADINDNFNSMLQNLDSTSEHPSAAGPGHFNDPDMLEVGNGGMTSDEYRSHFSLWAIMAAPLIAGTDITKMSDDTKSILTNTEVIAVDQDPAGIQGQLVADDGNGDQVWSKRLHTAGARAVALFNRSSAAATVTARWTDLGLAPGNAQVRDLWQHQDLGQVQDSYSTQVGSHAVVMLNVTGAEGTPPPMPVTYPAASGSNTLTGMAATAGCSVCAGGMKVTLLGTSGMQAGTIQFNGVMASTSGLKTIVIEYISAGSLSASVVVNGGAPLTVQFGDSGPPYGDIDSEVGTHVLQVQLNAGANTIAFSNSTALAPDLSAISAFIRD